MSAAYPLPTVMGGVVTVPHGPQHASRELKQGESMNTVIAATGCLI